MKNQLSLLAKECMNEKEAKEALLQKQDKIKRQLELERQFLPLLHKVRGPVGPKAKGQPDLDGGKRLKDATQVQEMPALTAGASPNKMRASQSMGALSNT